MMLGTRPFNTQHKGINKYAFFEFHTQNKTQKTTSINEPILNLNSTYEPKPNHIKNNLNMSSYSNPTLTTLIIILLTTISFTLIPKTNSQQEYVNNQQLDCYNTYNSTLGNICNSINSCQSYLTFKSTPNYNTPSSISNLLNTTPSLISQSNNIPTVQSFPLDTITTVPVNCSCSGNKNYYQHNTTYTLKTLGETYFTVANITYQALTTCQALIAQNPSHAVRDLNPGDKITVPLRCACPTKKQSDEGFKYLLTYLVSEGESVSSIADIFGADLQSVYEANELSSTSIIYYFTPLLIPLKNEPPKKIIKQASPPETVEPPDSGGSSSSKKWVIVGVAVGVVVLILVGLALFFLCFRRRKQPELPPSTVKKFSDSDTKKISDFNSTTTNTQSWSLSSEGIRYAVDSLTKYKYEELQNATNFFSEENKIKGSVYRASFKGDDAAVKILKGDVSSEINILKRINHANIIRLSGFCVYKGNTYLVYEFAENKSLNDWLHIEKVKSNSMFLSWFHRVQIAHNVADALNYLHNYANPPHVHKNLKSGNVLLDRNFRGKVSNFGLARVMENEGEEEGFQLTRHVIGTQGYMAPEYIENGLITPKMDVFAFGVVILELLSGREVVNDDKLLSSSFEQVFEGENVREKLRGFMDPNLRDEYPLELAYSMAEIAKRCVAKDLNLRPNVSEVFMVLSKIQSSTLDWDPSDEFERSRSGSHVSDSKYFSANV
ncbi:protein LYK5-like [Trifolium pratense]|uniref:protein LYK5-like n=1 Tax=Trifolium pratense TaxID=57577 RepID=UPI001E691B3E|nr:protein LYK5-like [Trifolium pratense]